jgi:hypothetical protein
MVDAGVTFADLYIFRQWKFVSEPAILIGMDALGVLDTLVIDYHQHDLEVLTQKSARSLSTGEGMKW